jgi:uncharacterized protein (DUF2062 family)
MTEETKIRKSRWNLKQILIDQLRQGTGPHELALSVALAAGVALFPLLGTTTALCLLVGHVKKLNHPTLQAVNYLLSPVQLIMIPVWVRIGEWITRSPQVALDPRAILPEFFKSPLLFMQHYGAAGAQGVLAWCLFIPGVIYLIYRAVLPLITRFAHSDRV